MKTNQEQMHELLQLTAYNGGADLRLMDTCPPQTRKHQSWVPLTSTAPLNEAKIAHLIGAILNEVDREKLSQKTKFTSEYVFDGVGKFLIKFTPAEDLGYFKEYMRVDIETVSLDDFELVEDKQFDDFSEDDQKKYLKRHENDMFRFVGFGAQHLKE